MSAGLKPVARLTLTVRPSAGGAGLRPAGGRAGLRRGTLHRPPHDSGAAGLRALRTEHRSVQAVISDTQQRLTVTRTSLQGPALQTAADRQAESRQGLLSAGGRSLHSEGDAAWEYACRSEVTAEQRTARRWSPEPQLTEH